MTEFWIISAPGDKTCQQTFDTMNNITSKQNNLSENFKMHIPDLKVGTLDQLVGLSDDLGKLDTYVETITRKLAGYLGEVLEDQRDKLQENLLANNSECRRGSNTVDGLSFIYLHILSYNEGGLKVEAMASNGERENSFELQFCCPPTDRRTNFVLDTPTATASNGRGLIRYL